MGRPVLEVARGLLGTRLVSTLGDERVEVVLVETEAYGGPDDPASHAAVRAGRTDRNRAMFGRAGRLYVYRSYGVHWCLNVVAGDEGAPQAVLLRGAEVLSGRDVVARRRGGRAPLAAGPGRLAQALGVVDGGLYGHDLTHPPLQLMPGWEVPDARVVRDGRIGVSRGAQRRWRFYLRDAPGVSPAR